MTYLDVDLRTCDTVRMEDRNRLAEAVTERRLELGLTQDEIAQRAGLKSRVTVGKVETGHPVKRRTLWMLDRALEWPHGATERLLRYGEQPVAEGARRQAQPPDVDVDYNDPEEAAIAALTRLPWPTRMALIHELRRRRAEETPADTAG